MLAFLAVIPISSVTAPIVSSQITKANNIHYVNENIYLDNKKQKSTTDESFFNLDGDNYQTTHRIYISSNKDKSLPAQENTIDDIIGKGKKDTWYDQSFSGLSLDITNYATNKTEFLNKYKSVNITYSYMENFWNGWNGWTNEYKKSPPIVTGVYTFNLKASGETMTVLQDSDSSHKSNEKVRFNLEISWNGNVLNLNWKLGVWYHWAAGSIYNHAALASFSHDSYNFLEIPTDDTKPNAEPKIGTIVKPSTFTLSGASKMSGLDKIDTELVNKSQQTDIKNSLYKSVPVIVQGYTGIKVVPFPGGFTTYSLSMTMTWYPTSQAVADSSKILLYGISFERILGIEFINSFYRTSYENIFGVKQYSSERLLDANVIGMKLVGAITVPYIYFA